MNGFLNHSILFVISERLKVVGTMKQTKYGNPFDLEAPGRPLGSGIAISSSAFSFLNIAALLKSWWVIAANVPAAVSALATTRTYASSLNHTPDFSGSGISLAGILWNTVFSASVLPL